MLLYKESGQHARGRLTWQDFVVIIVEMLTHSFSITKQRKQYRYAGANIWPTKIRDSINELTENRMGPTSCCKRRVASIQGGS